MENQNYSNGNGNGNGGNVAKPAWQTRIGAVSAAVFENKQQAQNGRQFSTFKVNVQGRFKDSRGEWQTTHSFRIDEIPKLVLALQQAYAQFVSQPAGDGEVGA